MGTFGVKRASDESFCPSTVSIANKPTSQVPLFLPIIKVRSSYLIEALPNPGHL